MVYLVIGGDVETTPSLPYWVIIGHDKDTHRGLVFVYRISLKLLQRYIPLRVNVALEMSFAYLQPIIQFPANHTINNIIIRMTLVRYSDPHSCVMTQG